MRLAALAFSTLLSLVAVIAPGHAEKRIGLVVGVNDYPNLKTARDPSNGQLAKAVADAETMGETLTGLGFDVEVGRNLSRTGFLTALDRMKRKIAAGDTVFVFFAGHGVAFKGTNLLLPSDIPPVDPEADQLIRGLAVAETDIIDAVREKGAGLTILALDACRNNPIEEFARETARIQGRAFRSTTMRSAGLETRPTSGVFSIYSAGIGQKALDGLGSDRGERNSVFTRVFAKKLREPGRHLSDIMEDVKEEVAQLAATEIDPDTHNPHRQFPAFYNETQGGRVFLAGRTIAVEPARPAGGVSVPTAAPAARPAPPPATAAVPPVPAAPPPAVAAPAPVGPPVVAALPPPPAPPRPNPALVATIKLPGLGAPETSSAVAWSAGGADVAAWQLKKTVRLGGALSETATSADRSAFVAGGERDGSIHLLDTATLAVRAKVTMAKYESYSLLGVALLADGKTAAVVRNGLLEFYDLGKQAKIGAGEVRAGYDSGRLTMSRDGQRLYHVRSNISVQRSIVAVYRRADDGFALEAEHPMPTRVDGLDVTADGAKFLLVTNLSSEVMLYDVATKSVVWTEKCQCSALFASGGRHVVFAGRTAGDISNFSRPSKIGVIDVANPKQQAIYDTGSTESLTVADVSPDGALVAVTATNTGEVMILPVTQTAAQLRPLKILKDNSRQTVRGAHFVGTDALVTASGDNNARLWGRK